MSNLSPIIDLYLWAKGLSRDGLAAAVDMDPNTLNRVIDSRVEITREAYDKLCEYIGIDEKILIAAGIAIKPEGGAPRKQRRTVFEQIGLEEPVLPLGIRRDTQDVPTKGHRETVELGHACQNCTCKEPEHAATDMVEAIRRKLDETIDKLPDMPTTLNRVVFPRPEQPDITGLLKTAGDTDAQTAKTLDAIYERVKRIDKRLDKVDYIHTVLMGIEIQCQNILRLLYQLGD